MTLQEAQENVDRWIKSYGVRYFNELTNMAILTEEVGEVARIIARRYGEQSFKESDKKVDLADELADVLWVLLCWPTRRVSTSPKPFNATSTRKPHATNCATRRTQSSNRTFSSKKLKT